MVGDVVPPEEADLVHPAVVPVVEEVPKDHRLQQREPPVAEVGEATLEEPTVHLSDHALQSETDGDVAGQQTEAPQGVLLLVSERHERIR